MLTFPVPPPAQGVAGRLRPSAVVAGLTAGVLAVLATNQATKDLVKAVALMVILVVAAHSRRPRLVLLFCWVAGLTYNRNYFFDAFARHGSYGPFWSPADVFLAALLGLWGYELIVLKRRAGPVGGPLWPWFLPFALTCALSAATAHRWEWTLFEMARVGRIGLVLCYARYCVRQAELWACVAGFAAGIVIQAGLGVVYLATGQELGLAALFGAGEEAQRFKYLTGDISAYAYRRAQGTLGHSNTLSLYLLMVLPIFGALAFAARRSALRLLSGAVAVLGLMGLASTLSRTGWALSLAECAVLAAGLLALGLASPRRILGVGAVGGLLALVALAPFAGRIEERLTGDFDQQVQFRERHDRIALDIWQRSPLTGIGLNNYSDNLREYGLDEVNVTLKLAEAARTVVHVRFTAWVHNIYLLMLAETGLLGLAAFLLFLGAMMVIGLRAILLTGGVWRCLAFGIVVGMMAAHLSGLQESALWIDPATYTFALLAGLTNNLVPLARAEGVLRRPAGLGAPAHREVYA